MSQQKQPTKAQVMNAAHILENFAKKGMVGYAPPIDGGAKKPAKKPAAKKAPAKKPAAKKAPAKKPVAKKAPAKRK